MLNYSTSHKRQTNFGFHSELELPISKNIFFPSPVHYTALVVDDMSVNRLVIKMILEGFKLEVDEACNGKVAVEICKNKLKTSKQSKPYDIIFMDIDMPIMNGIIAAEQITELFKVYPWGKNLPIIAVTAFDTQQIKEESLAAGMKEFAPKPLKADLVEYYLKKYLTDFTVSLAKLNK